MSERSQEISSLLNKYIDKNNFLNFESSMKGLRRDAIALG